VSIRGKLRFVILAIALAAADLISKSLAFSWVESHGVPSSLHYGEKAIEIVPGFFYITKVLNPGGIWGIAQQGILSSVLVVFRAIALPVIAYMALRTPAHDRALLTALALFFAGAIGNLYDNLVHEGGVRDFLDFYLIGREGYHWPTFNIADASICCGVVLILAASVFGRRSEPARA
jgi:signal peptidase II